MRFLALAALVGLAAAAGEAGTAEPTGAPPPRYGEGCWVRFFDGKTFEAPLGIVGSSAYLNSFTGPGLIGHLDLPEFFRRASSLEVGPQARLILYGEPGFREEILTLEPGHKQPDLEAIRFHERAASLKVTCPFPGA